MKVICAGLPKTGTKSTVTALRTLGYTVYDSPEHILYHKQEWKELLDGHGSTDTFRKMYEDVDAVADTPACAMWDHIFEAFPDAKVILTVRDNDEEWYDSFKRHFKRYGETYPVSKNSETLDLLTRLASTSLNRDWRTINNGIVACFGFQACSDNTNEMLAKTAYRRHNTFVKATCPPERLLIFNVKDGWDPLCEFLGVDSSTLGPFPHINKNGEITSSNLGFKSLATVRKTMINQLIEGLLMKFGIVILIAAVFVLL